MMNIFKRKGRLLSNRLSKVSLKLEISNVKTGLNKCVVFFLSVCFFPVNIVRFGLVPGHMVWLGLDIWILVSLFLSRNSVAENYR